MKIVTWNELKALLNSPPSSLDFTLEKKYSAWRKIDKEDMQKFEELGQFEYPIKHESEYLSEQNYWSEDYPIALGYYPNNGCKVMKSGGQYFFLYMDFGGHSPEKRCRYINKELIIES